MQKDYFSNDKNFDAFLQARAVTPPHADMAARIVAAAWRAAQVPSISLYQWLRELFADFMLPRPAYAFSGILLAGVLVGFVFGPVLATQDASGNPQMILSDEGDMP